MSTHRHSHQHINTSTPITDSDKRRMSPHRKIQYCNNMFMSHKKLNNVLKSIVNCVFWDLQRNRMCWWLVFIRKLMRWWVDDIVLMTIVLMCWCIGGCVDVLTCWTVDIMLMWWRWYVAALMCWCWIVCVCGGRGGGWFPERALKKDMPSTEFEPVSIRLRVESSSTHTVLFTTTFIDTSTHQHNYQRIKRIDISTHLRPKVCAWRLMRNCFLVAYASLAQGVVLVVDVLVIASMCRWLCRCDVLLCWNTLTHQLDQHISTKTHQHNTMSSTHTSSTRQHINTRSAHHNTPTPSSILQHINTSMSTDTSI
jgi:hypothetical protein